MSGEAYIAGTKRLISATSAAKSDRLRAMAWSCQLCGMPMKLRAADSELVSPHFYPADGAAHRHCDEASRVRSNRSRNRGRMGPPAEVVGCVTFPKLDVRQVEHTGLGRPHDGREHLATRTNILDVALLHHFRGREVNSKPLRVQYALGQTYADVIADPSRALSVDESRIWRAPMRFGFAPERYDEVSFAFWLQAMAWSETKNRAVYIKVRADMRTWSTPARTQFVDATIAAHSAMSPTPGYRRPSNTLVYVLAPRVAKNPSVLILDDPRKVAMLDADTLEGHDAIPQAAGTG